MAENTAGGQDIQHPISATDEDRDRLTYRLSGDDADSFTLNTNNGQLRTRSGVTYDYEDKDRYSVTVEADDGRGGGGAIDVTIYVADVDEPPEAPARPRVEPASSTSLTVTWTEPANTGHGIDDYDLQYRKSGSFLPWPHTGPGATTTISDLDLNTRYEVQVRAINDEGTSLWSSSGYGTTSTNLAPVFDETAPTRSLSENTPPNRNIGTPVRATDPEGRTVSYSLVGGDTDQFTLISSIGQLRTQTGVTYNFETQNRYSVRMEVQDDQGGRATITVTIELTDDDNERPDTPDKPSVTASTLNSLSIRWTAPANTGPDVNDYDVHYSEDGGAFTDWPHVGPGTTTTITGLKANTPYEVQVLARSDEGESLWSESVDVRTIANRAPTFNEGTSTTRTLAENTTGTTDIGNPITATDGDGGTLRYRLEGTDQASFTLDGNQLQTIAGVAYDYEEKSSYVVIVRVQDGQGGSNTIEVTINLIDEQEPPEAPAAPSVSAASSTSLTVTWDEPATTGPDVDDYDIQYHEGDSGGFTSWPHNSVDRTATLTNLTPGTSYQAQVLARNAEGTSDWSPSGTGSIHPNQPPVFTDGSSTTRSFAENTTGVQNIGDPLSATDPEGTPLTYSLEGTDADAFTIVTGSGQLRTKSDQTYNHEAKPRYVVSVKATDGHSGERTITVLINLNDVNEPPSFTSDATFETEENNRSIGRVDAVDVDNGDGITGYTLTGGSDRDRFEINSGGVLTFKDAPDFEDPTDAGRNNQFSVVVTATGGTGGSALTATQTIAVSVTDENEPPQTPAEPTVTALSPAILRVTWTEPTNTGPGITDYDVQYRQGTSGAFTDVNYNGTGTTTTLIGLNPNTMYQVQVLARNDEGPSEWSDSGEGRTNTTGTPGKPDPPTLTAPYSLTLRIKWTAPENSGGTPITGYKLQYGKDGGQLEEYFRVFTDTETTFRSQPPGTAFEIQVRAINNDGPGEWSNSAFGSVQPNKLPTFDEASPVRSFAENTEAGQNIGEPLFVTDDYIGQVGIAFSLEGTDAQNFNIVKVLGKRGQLQTKDGVTYDYETNNSYSVTVMAVDPQGGSATVDATIELTDVDEPPSKPGTPKVEASTLTSLTLVWTAPDNTGKPAISSYDVQYRIGTGTFTVVNYDGTDTRATVGSLNANTDYELQVRARNDEGGGKWSDPVNGTPSDNQPPVFAGDGRFEVAENEATVSTVVATDADNQDSVTGYEISGGADEAQFEITSGNTLAFKTAPDFERPADVASTQPSSAAGDNEYIVEVTATSGTGDRVKTTVLPIIVTVTDALEPPGKIDMPTASASGGPRNLTVEWSVPENTGPDIGPYGYEVQYRIAESGDAFANGRLSWYISATNLKKADVLNLKNNTSYEVQVRAINDEGAGEWSDSATGTTFNEPPTVTDLGNRTLTVGGGAEIIRLIDGFNDTHGIAWYAAASNNNAFATTGVAGDHLTIRPVAEGNTSVEITARDEYGLSATQTIDVSVQAATLPNPVVAFDTDNEDLTIQFTDRFEVEETRAYDVRVRQQNPLGLVGQTRATGTSSWVTGCVEQSNPETVPPTFRSWRHWELTSTPARPTRWITGTEESLVVNETTARVSGPGRSNTRQAGPALSISSSSSKTLRLRQPKKLYPMRRKNAGRASLKTASRIIRLAARWWTTCRLRWNSVPFLREPPRQAYAIVASRPV